MGCVEYRAYSKSTETKHMHQESEAIRAAIEAATEGMELADLCWHPEGKWCTAEILEHLSLTYSGTAKGMCKVLEKSDKPKVRSATWKERVRKATVVGIGYFPSGREAPEHVVPRIPDAENILKKVQANLAAMDDAIGNCERRYGRGATVLVHPILGPLTLAQWRKFHRVHCLHHMKQIRLLRTRVKEKTPKPG